MSEASSESEEIPPTDLCENCGREIVPEVVKLKGKDELIHEARTAKEGWMSATAGTATIRFKCRCSHVDVEYGPGSASAWDFPDSWMWEDEIQTDDDQAVIDK